MCTASIEPYQTKLLPELIAMLQTVLFVEPITEEAFALKVLLDPNFDPNGAFVALSDAGAVVGFALALTRRRPLEDGPSDANQGWITQFGVAPEFQRRGIGAALLDQAERWLSDQGCTEVWISPYAPHYWTPGVDEAAYPAAILFLRARGYEIVSRPLSMDLSLIAWRIPEWAEKRARSDAVSLESFRIAAISDLTDFLRCEFPGDWQRYVRETMLEIVAGRRSAEELLLARSLEDGGVLGFAQSERERFGPFGVAASARGRGIGALLLYRMLDAMRLRGLHNAWFLWTDDRTADRLYRPAGFRETRRYAVMRKISR